MEAQHHDRAGHRFHNAGVHGKAFSLYERRRHAGANHGFEDVPEEIAVAKAAMTLRPRSMARRPRAKATPFAQSLTRASNNSYQSWLKACRVPQEQRRVRARLNSCQS
jgi:hypothetical protein